jgi:hypothetical protein
LSDDDNGRDPYDEIADSDEIAGAFADQAEPVESIVPKRDADLWLTRDAKALERMLQLLFAGVPETIVAPASTPLAVIRGPENRRFLWGDGESRLPDEAEPTTLSLRDALLRKSPKRSMVLAESAHPQVPCERIILCMPPLLADPHIDLLSQHPVSELRVRAVVWLEKTSGAIAARDTQRFLKSIRKSYPVHIVMQNVLYAAQTAIAGDESEPVAGTVRQFVRFVEKDFCPWMHVTK